MKINYLRTYTHQLFNNKFGDKIKIGRNEKIEDRIIETNEEIPRKVELSIFELEEKPEYNLHIEIPKKEKTKYDIEGYIKISIEGIGLEEMRNLCQNFNNLYEKIKTKKIK